MEKEDRIRIARILLSALLLAVCLLLPVSGWMRIACFLVPYLLVGYDILLETGENLLHGQWMDEAFLMTVATAAAFFLGEYPEAVFVMLFFQIGEVFEDLAVEKNRRSIRELMDLRPDRATVLRNGAEEYVRPEQVQPGEILLVRPGERVPLDGTVTEGRSAVQTMALTGESLPRSVAAGSDVLSGFVNLSGVISVRVEKTYDESAAARVLELVEHAAEKKSAHERFITHFARWYTPTMVAAAVVIGVLPPLFGGAWALWLHRAMIFLIISCPCALVVSVPLAYFAGIGNASRCGILVKGGKYLDILAGLDTVALDKTGTLTRGEFRVTEIHPKDCTERELLELAAQAENRSNHPLAKPVREACPELPDAVLTDAEELTGLGMRLQIDGKTVLAGNGRLMQMNGIAAEPCEGTAIHMARDGAYLGWIRLEDTLREHAKDTAEKLRQLGIRKIAVLSGDRESAVRSAAERIGADTVFAELLPADKVQRLESLLQTGTAAFVGDGINDAPVLARADVGIAMGGLGSDAAMEAADAVLMQDDLSCLVDVIQIARRTGRTARENIFLALAVKALIAAWTLFGNAPMWTAVFADVGVLIITVLHAVAAGRK